MNSHLTDHTWPVRRLRETIGRASRWAMPVVVAGVTSLGTLAARAEGNERPPRPALPLRVSEQSPAADVLIVVGAEGTPEFGAMFQEWAATWATAARAGGCRVLIVGPTSDPQVAPGLQSVNRGGGDEPTGEAPDDIAKVALRQALTAARNDRSRPLWLLMIGHGTFDGRTAKFNLVGEDVTAQELADWLLPLERPLAIVQCASASGAFLELLSGKRRVVITATKSGQETSFARFGGYLARAWADPEADLDKDDQVSLLEAFLRGARQTAEFYSGENRLATEHAMLDDNGDGRGTRAEAFQGIRPVRDAESGTTLDGYFAHQWTLVPSAEEQRFPAELRARRDALEREVLQLREMRSTLDEDEYYRLLEPLLLELARLYEPVR